MHTAIDLGFLTNNETRPRKPFRLVLKHGVDEAGVSLLPDPADDHPGRRCRMTSPLVRLVQSGAKRSAPDRLLITLMKSPAGALLQRFPGVLAG